MTEDRIKDIETKLVRIESRMNTSERQQAVDALRWTHMESQLTDIKSIISDIKSDGKWVVRLIIGGLITAGTIFVINGGLIGPV